MDSQPREAVFQVDCRGQTRTFAIPDQGSTRIHVTNILTGQDYPLVPLPAFSPALIVDIGANLGASVLYFAAAYPDTRIVCFEPSAANLAYLRRNTAFDPLVDVRPFALGDRRGAARLFQGRNLGMQCSLYPSAEVSEQFEMVEVRKAADELAGFQETPWLVKIDVEGAELAILESMAPLFERIGVLYLEYHSEDERLAFDRLLTAQFALWQSAAAAVHRGNVTYVAKSLLNDPAFTRRAIKPE